MSRVFKEALIPISHDTRIRLKLFRAKGRGLVAFTSQLEYYFNQKWRPVVRYDTAHGFVHKDVYSIAGKQKRKERVPINELRDAVLFADKDLRTNYEIYIKKFKRDEL